MDSKDMDKSIVCGFFGPPCIWTVTRAAPKCFDVRLGLRGKVSEMLCTVLCTTTVVHSDKHTRVTSSLKTDCKVLDFWCF